MAYIPYIIPSVGSTLYSTTNVTGIVRNSDTANISAALSNSSGFAGGNGESANSSFAVESGNAATILVTYTNTGNGAAYNFSVESVSGFSSGYSITSSTCNGVLLESANTVGNTCTVALNVPTSQSTEKDLSLASNSIAVSWSDESGIFTKQEIDWNNSNVTPTTIQNTIYVNIYNTGSVVTCASLESGQCSAFESIVANTNFYLYYTLSGGYPEETFIFLPTYNESRVGICSLTGNAGTKCNVPVNSGIAGNGAIYFGGSSTGGVTPKPESSVITVHSSSGSIIVTTHYLANNGTTMQAESFNIVATISGSNITSQTVSVSNLSTFEAAGVVITSNPSPCILQNNTGSPVVSCTFSVTPAWNYATPADYTVMLAGSDIIPSPSSVTFTVESPAVYLPQTGESSGTIGCPTVGESAAGADCKLQTGIPITNSRFVRGSGLAGSCITDTLTGLMWESKPSSTTYSWTNAIANVESMNTAPSAPGYNLCGFTDWRLPNINELRSLINYGQASPDAWLNTQGFSNVQHSHYWSSSVYASSKGYAWYVSFNDGSMSGRSTSNSYYVWPVRGGR